MTTTAHEDRVLGDVVHDAGPADADAFVDRLAALTIPIGDPVFLGAVLTGGPSVADGGAARLDDLDVPTRDGRTERWQVDEWHCPNPGCRCGEVRLFFVRGASVVVAEVRPDRPVPRVIETTWATRPRAAEVLAAYAATCSPPGASHDSAMVALSRRCFANHAAVKAAARRWVASRRAPSTWPPPGIDDTPPPSLPSRNGTCPCGSGRKFKRCCGK